ncbi:hypothetical protein K470DRAFT_259473 [Piedraia hortae CBS 480.64]|uniref:GATA-type domain-containing protein n=1 Tax=Piedraia hortae CBS 480.64 TaxID=1314780 RepID=A0A6A7BUW0_9PEZI|nr:hypothetical protein K470DRAFT_259473 [Piedraia hortae CBS 480.64]
MTDDPDQDLLLARRANKERLRNSFETLFDKYSRDFTGIGDEIDLVTGEIVVDNGHVSNLQPEGGDGIVAAFSAGCEPGDDESEEEHAVQWDEVRNLRIGELLAGEGNGVSELGVKIARAILSGGAFAREKRPRSASPLDDSLWEPGRAPRVKRRRKTVSVPVVAEEEDADAARMCSNCKATSSSTWRRDPEGGMLCNPCGMYFYRYDQMRPEPEFVPDNEAPEGEMMLDPALFSSREGTPTRPTHHGKFTVEEDALIVYLKEAKRMSWESIASHFPQRSSYAIQGRYAKHLHKKPCEGREFFDREGPEYFSHLFRGEDTDDQEQSPHIQPKVQRLRQSWTPAEDKKLVRLREKDGLRWDQMTLQFPDRTMSALQKRFVRLKKSPLAKRTCPSNIKRKRRRLPDEEEEELVEGSEEEREREMELEMEREIEEEMQKEMEEMTDDDSDDYKEMLMEEDEQDEEEEADERKLEVQDSEAEDGSAVIDWPRAETAVMHKPPVQPTEPVQRTPAKPAEKSDTPSIFPPDNEYTSMEDVQQIPPQESRPSMAAIAETPLEEQQNKPSPPVEPQQAPPRESRPGVNVVAGKQQASPAVEPVVKTPLPKSRPSLPNSNMRSGSRRKTLTTLLPTDGSDDELGC